MLGFEYTDCKKGHISIGLFVDKFPKKAQHLMDCLAYILTIGVCSLIAYTYIGVAHEHQHSMRLSTDLLSIHFYPFDRSEELTSELQYRGQHVCIPML